MPIEKNETVEYAEAKVNGRVPIFCENGKKAIISLASLMRLIFPSLNKVASAANGIWTQRGYKISQRILGKKLQSIAIHFATDPV